MTSPLPKSSYPFFVHEHVRFNDLDALGHVNNNSFGIYFESARIGLMMVTGLRGDPTDPAVVVRRFEIDYLAELHFPAALEIGIGVARIGTSSVALSAGLFRGEECISTSTAVMVRIDAAARRPMALTEAERKLMQPYMLG